MLGALFFHAVRNIQTVRTPRIKPDHKAAHHGCALGTHPETEGPAEKRKFQMPREVAPPKRDGEPNDQQHGNDDDDDDDDDDGFIRQ